MTAESGSELSGCVMSGTRFHNHPSSEPGYFGKTSFSKSLRTKKSARKTGIWKRIGRHDAAGLILFSL